MKHETAKFGRLIRLNLSLLKVAGVLSRGEQSVERIALACLTFVFTSIYAVSYSNAVFRRLDTLLSLSLVLSFVGALLRLQILLFFRCNCCRMLDFCDRLWSGLDLKEKQTISKYTKKSTRLAVYYVMICMTAIAFYTAVSLYVYLLTLGSGGTNLNAVNNSNVSFDIHAEIGRSLPYAFLFDVQRSPWYEIAFAFEIFSMTEVSLAAVGVDSTGPMFSLIACGHFEVLRSRIENLISTSASSSSSSAETENLRMCLKYHQNLLEFCEEIERIANLISLTQLIMSTYNISLVGFKLVGDDPEKYKYTPVLLIPVIQLFLCNWPADVLLTKSESIADTAYFLPWYRDPVRLRIPIVMLLMRARRPARLTAGKFVELSLETFGSMVSTSISFFTVVRSTN